MAMKHMLLALGLFALAACAAAPQSPEAADNPPLASEAQLIAAERAPPVDESWSAPFAPFNVIGNIYYVGSAGVSAYLITTPQGHFLIDGGPPQAAPQIIANIAALGFNIRDVKYLLNTHAHYDHAGGLARLQRASRAQIVANERDRAPLETGRISYGPPPHLYRRRCGWIALSAMARA